jgi:hypothetical protein
MCVADISESDQLALGIVSCAASPVIFLRNRQPRCVASRPNRSDEPKSDKQFSRESDHLLLALRDLRLQKWPKLKSLEMSDVEQAETNPRQSKEVTSLLGPRHPLYDCPLLCRSALSKAFQTSPTFAIGDIRRCLHSSRLLIAANVGGPLHYASP